MFVFIGHVCVFNFFCLASRLSPQAFIELKRNRRLERIISLQLFFALAEAGVNAKVHGSIRAR